MAASNQRTSVKAKILNIQHAGEGRLQRKDARPRHAVEPAVEPLDEPVFKPLTDGIKVMVKPSKEDTLAVKQAAVDRLQPTPAVLRECSEYVKDVIRKNKGVTDDLGLHPRATEAEVMREFGARPQSAFYALRRCGCELDGAVETMERLPLALKLPPPPPPSPALSSYITCGRVSFCFLCLSGLMLLCMLASLVAHDWGYSAGRCEIWSWTAGTKCPLLMTPQKTCGLDILVTDSDGFYKWKKHNWDLPRTFNPLSGVMEVPDSRFDCCNRVGNSCCGLYDTSSLGFCDSWKKRSRNNSVIGHVSERGYENCHEGSWPCLYSLKSMESLPSSVAGSDTTPEGDETIDELKIFVPFSGKSWMIAASVFLSIAVFLCVMKPSSKEVDDEQKELKLLKIEGKTEVLGGRPTDPDAIEEGPTLLQIIKACCGTAATAFRQNCGVLMSMISCIVACCKRCCMTKEQKRRALRMSKSQGRKRHASKEAADACSVAQATMTSSSWTSRLFSTTTSSSKWFGGDRTITSEAETTATSVTFVKPVKPVNIEDEQKAYTAAVGDAVSAQYKGQWRDGKVTKLGEGGKCYVDVDGLGQDYLMDAKDVRPKETATAAAPVEATELKLVFEPGTVGISANFETGLVEHVADGKEAHKWGVRAGMRFLTVRGKPYTARRYFAARDGTDIYEVTFAKENVESRPQTQGSNCRPVSRYRTLQEFAERRIRALGSRPLVTPLRQFRKAKLTRQKIVRERPPTEELSTTGVKWFDMHRLRHSSYGKRPPMPEYDDEERWEVNDKVGDSPSLFIPGFSSRTWNISPLDRGGEAEASRVSAPMRNGKSAWSETGKRQTSVSIV